MKRIVLVIAGVGGLLGLVLGYGLVVYDNGFSGFRYRQPAPVPDEIRPYGTRVTVSIPAVDDTRLEAWLYHVPHSPAPLIIMAPGLASTKEDLLEPFAWRFLQHGYSVLLFDYRCFGGSGGVPRHWVDMGRHSQDYEAVIDYARDTFPEDGPISPQQIILWGSSFSGGTVIYTAARLEEPVQAVIAQVPFLDMAEEQAPARSHMWRYIPWTTLDMLRASLQLEPIYTPLFGKPGEFAFVRSHENPPVANYRHKDADQSAFWSLIPQQHRGGWENKMLARIFADIERYIPIKVVGRIHCPIYFVAAAHDEMTPSRYIEKAHALVAHDKKGLARFDSGHYAVYFGDTFEDNIRGQLAFLDQYVK